MTDAKAVLITGGAKRVGAALSRNFARHGYDVALHYNTSKAEALALKTEIESLGRRCELVCHDLSDVSGMPELMTQLKDRMPHCGALINNASIFEPSTLLETDEAFLDRQFAVNFKAPFFLTQAFAKTFGKGSVVNILDTDIVQTQGSHIAYLLSKKTLAEFTCMAARALGPAVRVNAVSPGGILPSDAQDKLYIDKLPDKLPLGKIAALEDLVESVRWLCENASVTGQIMFVDGGQHLL